MYKKLISAFIIDLKCYQVCLIIREGKHRIKFLI